MISSVSLNNQSQEFFYIFYNAAFFVCVGVTNHQPKERREGKQRREKEGDRPKMKEQKSLSLSLSLSLSPLSPMFTRVQARITRSQAHYSPTRSSRREECTKIDEYTSVFLRTIFSFISLPQRKKREGPLHYIGYVKNLGEKTETTMTTRGQVKENVPARQFSWTWW